MAAQFITPFDLAQRFVGIREVSGANANPQIMAMLKLDKKWPEDDDVAWCSAFTNYVAWLLRLPRSKDLRARSWLTVGRPIDLDDAEVGYDVVVLKRKGRNEPGPDVLDAKGHVGFFAGREASKIILLGGNQSDEVSVARYPASRLLGIRRIAIAPVPSPDSVDVTG